VAQCIEAAKASEVSTAAEDACGGMSEGHSYPSRSTHILGPRLALLLQSIPEAILQTLHAFADDLLEILRTKSAMSASVTE